MFRQFNNDLGKDLRIEFWMYLTEDAHFPITSYPSAWPLPRRPDRCWIEAHVQERANTREGAPGALWQRRPTNRDVFAVRNDLKRREVFGQLEEVMKMELLSWGQNDEGIGATLKPLFTKSGTLIEIVQGREARHRVADYEPELVIRQA